MCLIWGREPGCAPGGAVTFSCLAKRKSPKRRRPYCACPFAALRATCDARSGGAPQNSLRAARSVQTTAASQCTKCVCPSAHARTPCPALLGTHRREPATGHPHGPSLRSAPSARAQAPRAALSRPNAAMARMAVGLLGCWAVGLLGCWAVGLLGCHPPSVCAWGAQEAGWRGCAAGHTRASSTDSPRLSERSAAGAQ